MTTGHRCPTCDRQGIPDSVDETFGIVFKCLECFTPDSPTHAPQYWFHQDGVHCVLLKTAGDKPLPKQGDKWLGNGEEWFVLSVTSTDDYKPLNTYPLSSAKMANTYETIALHTDGSGSVWAIDRHNQLIRQKLVIHQARSCSTHQGRSGIIWARPLPNFIEFFDPLEIQNAG